MIKDKKIKIKINPSNFNHYKDKYDIKCGETIEIDILDLYENSKSKINVICDVCGKEKMIANDMYNKNIKNGGYYACSRKCAQKKIENTTIEKYGVENPFQSDIIKEKIKETNLVKYGVEYYTQTEEMLSKTKETCLEKYGVEHHLQKSDIFEKQIQTNLEKYGVNYYSQTEMFKNKIKKTYNNKIIENFDNVINIDNDYYHLICECGDIFKLNINQYNRFNLIDRYCQKCKPIKSNKESQLLEFIKNNYSGKIIENKRNIINPYELDIYLPDFSLAFEFNGLYWHSELYKPKNYHRIKTELCEEKNIQIIQIWGDDWNFKQDIVKSIILNKLGQTKEKIYARKTKIKEITDNKLIREFLNNNHIQGYINSSIKIGLFYENKLVSLMTLGKKRKFMNSKSNDGEYELLRFCNKKYTNVIGGASKLFKYFIKNYSFIEITTYVDRSYSNGKLYETLGFEFVSKTEPNYFYIVNKIRKHRFSFRKDVLIKEGYDPNKTEHEIMLERKIYRIYNSGNLKFIYS
jgi:hypothetical protein